MTRPAEIYDVVKAVTTAGTAVALVSSDTFVTYLCLQAKKVGGDNTGPIFIGISTLDGGVREIIERDNQETWTPIIPAGRSINLADIYIDADNAADGVVGIYFK